MISFKRNFREEPQSYPTQICIVDKISRRVASLAKIAFGLPVVEPEPNNNVLVKKPLTNTIYVLPEFEDHPMFDIIQRTPNTWILGPTALQEMANNSSLEMRSKPTYCTFMYGNVFYINCPENIPLMKRMVQLLKWMGGLFVVEPNFQTTHMITNSSRASGYTYCYTFNLPILSPEWVEHCWKNRHVLSFKPASVMGSFKVSTFLDLYLSFKGFYIEELTDVTSAAKAHGAVVVHPEDPRCTHLILSNSIVDHVNIQDIPTHIVHVVKESWFLQSLEQNQHTYEDFHRCFSLKEVRKSLWAVVDAEEIHKVQKKSTDFRALLSKEDKVMLDNEVMECQDKKRKFAFQELYETEKNYLHCLKHLVNLKHWATELTQPGGAILNEMEAKAIFINLEEIIEVHQNLVAKFENILLHWKNDVFTGQPIIQLKDELIKQYVIYTNNYKESQRKIELCEKENRRFRKFLAESMKTSKLEHPKGIFIRPIQRLCSVSLLLREINKNTREDNPDKKTLKETIDVINDVLNNMNENGRNTDKLRCIFDIHRLIEGCPPDLITSHREFVIQFTAKEIVDNKNGIGVQVMFFLFNDILEITKVRSRAQAILKNGNSITPMREKPYKHIATLPLSMVLNLIKFEGKDESDQNIFGFIIRDIKEEEKTYIHCFQYPDDNSGNLDDTLRLVAKQLSQRDSSKSPEDYILERVPTKRLNIHPIYCGAQQRLFSSAVDKMSNILKKPPKKVLRKSLSCGDLLDTANIL